MTLENINNNSSSMYPTLSPEKKSVTIHKFSQLNEEQQKVALEAITSINLRTSTSLDGTTWENYTSTIKSRIKVCPHAKETLFVAEVTNKFVGYVAFYTRQDELYTTSKYLDNKNQAYCSWIAVDPDFRGSGVAMELKLQIFDPKEGISAVREHIKKTNVSSLKIVEKFRLLGYQTAIKDAGHQVLCTITKPYMEDDNLQQR